MLTTLLFIRSSFYYPFANGPPGRFAKAIIVIHVNLILTLNKYYKKTSYNVDCKYRRDRIG